MTIATIAQHKHRRSYWKQMRNAAVRKAHQRKVSAAVGLGGASKTQLRAVADQAWAEFSTARGLDPKPSGGDLAS